MRSYGEAYGRKDAKQISTLWPSIPAKDLRDIRTSFRDFRTLKLDLRPLAEPDISGTTAVVRCTRSTEAVDRNGTYPTEDS